MCSPSFVDPHPLPIDSDSGLPINCPKVQQDSGACPVSRHREGASIPHVSCASIRLEDTYKQRVGWMLADAISHPLLQWACTPESVSKLAEYPFFHKQGSQHLRCQSPNAPVAATLNKICKIEMHVPCESLATGLLDQRLL